MLGERVAATRGQSKNSRLGARALVCVCSLFLVLPAHAADIIDVEKAHLELDGGVTLDVTGGAWLSTPKLFDWADEHKRLVTENATLKSEAGSIDAKAVVIAAAVGLAAGITGTLAVTLLTKK